MKDKERAVTLGTLLRDELNTAVLKAVTSSNMASSQDIQELTNAVKTLTRVIADFSRLTQQIKTKSPAQIITRAAKVESSKEKKNREKITLVEKGKIPVRVCSVKGCGRKHYARGMCKNHYYADLRKKKLAALAAGLPLLTKPARRRKPGPRVCSIKGCEEKHYAKGLCKKHYMAKFFKNRKYLNKKQSNTNR